MEDSDTAGRVDWDSIEELPSHEYLVPAALRWVEHFAPKRLLDLGCGDGRLSAELAQGDSAVTGLDFSTVGIARARERHPEVAFIAQSLAVPLPEEHQGQFDMVTAIEVIEHLLLPRQLFVRAREALGHDGWLLITTPYHGYFKNVALALAGKWDHHHDVLLDYGHVKFFSRSSLGAMAHQMGFEVVNFERVGRIPPLAASMVVVLRPRSGDGTTVV
ncbi:class I SAM-dependent methyltransferase [Nocardioides sp.]|uniref:class I SAM-dependent methyltransferase n=1 Tax=Nocardioides sp. TaxID=35761 RepID=UPI003569681E